MFKVGKSCTPSEILESKQDEGIEVLITFGGGMGGSKKKYYTKNTVSLLQEKNNLCGPNDFLLKNIDGEEVVINHDFVVSKRLVKLVTIVSDITGHVNYQAHRVNQAIETRVFAIPMNETVEVFDDYRGDNSGELVFNDVEEK